MYGFPRPATDIHTIQTQMRYRLGSAQGRLIPKGAPLKNKLNRKLFISFSILQFENFTNFREQPRWELVPDHSAAGGNCTELCKPQ